MSTNQSDYKWLLLIYNLPPKPSKCRVSIWRNLKILGAISLRKSVYILPFNSETYENFQWLCQEIQTMKGEATLVKVTNIEKLKDKDSNNIEAIENSVTCMTFLIEFSICIIHK